MRCLVDIDTEHWMQEILVVGSVQENLLFMPRGLTEFELIKCT